MFKHIFLPWLLPIFGMFFAAGADALAGGDVSAPVTGDTGGEDLGYGSDVEADTEQIIEKPADKVEVQPEKQEEPEATEFRVPVGRRMVGLVNKYPKLKEAFASHPELQKELEPVFRREAAFREIFPTIAEARQLREELPNGVADLQQLRNDVQEVEQLDNDFYTRDRDGNYPGHQKIVENMFRDDRDAAVSLFRSLPKQWANLDRDSYNEVMGHIVGATFAQSREMADLDDALQSGDANRLAASVKKLFGWANGFIQGKPKPSEEEVRLQRDKQDFAKQRADSDKQEGQKFHTNFVSESRKLQTGIIKNHIAVKRVLENKTISEQKKGEIVEQIRQSIESLLGKSPSFMRKLEPAYESRKMQDIIDLQKAAWSQQWLLNRMVRTVLNKEIPQMVSQNREVVRRRAGTPTTATPGKKSSDSSPQGPKQIDGRWYRDGGKGAPFTTAEVLAGKHLL